MSYTRKTKKPSPPTGWTGTVRTFADSLFDDVAKSIVTFGKLDAERDYLIQRAPNAIEWITSAEYCNQPTLFKHIGQYIMVKEFFELRCPNCNDGPKAVPRIPWTPGRPETVLSRSILESEVLLTWSQRDEDDRCPKCHTTRAQFIEDGMMMGYHTLHGIVGMRAGKSAALALVGTYVEHIMLAIAHGYDGGLQSYLGTQPGDQFDITYVASTDVQSKDTIWAKYRGFRRMSPWFQRYVPWIKTQEALQQTPEGMQRWEYDENDKSIKNECIRVIINSLNSNSGGLVGRTRLGAFIDEVCRMKQTDSSMGAAEVYRGLEASCHTVRTRVETYGLLPWLGMVGSISSPVSAEDKGMKLLEDAKRVKRMYTFHLPTWKFNPFEPREKFDDDFRKDPMGAERDFGANPPMAASPLIDDPLRFRDCAIAHDLQPTATFEEYEFDDEVGHKYKAIKLVKADLIRNGAPRYVAVDAGRSFDAFAVACAHPEEDKDGNIITVYDWVMRLLPRQGQEIYFEAIYNLVVDLTKSCFINQIEFDHWNSAHIVQKIRQLGIRAEENETKGKHFVQFLRDGYSGYVKMLPPAEGDEALDPPYKSPAGVALYELEHLDRDPEKDKVFNPKKGEVRGHNSDDVARVIVHAHRLVQDIGYTQKYDDTGLRARRKRAESMAAEWASMERGLVFSPSSMPSLKGGGRGW